jgi:hypothetical protein
MALMLPGSFYDRTMAEDSASTCAYSRGISDCGESNIGWRLESSVRCVAALYKSCRAAWHRYHFSCVV